MHPSNTLQEKITQYQQEGVKRIKLGLADIDGVLRGKYIHLDKFAAIANSTSGFCDCILGWDVNDRLYDNATYTGWHTAFPDVSYRLDLATERRLTDENNTPYFIAELVPSPTERFHPICPRNLLKKILAKGESMGFGFNLAFEYEFFIFHETMHSVREKNYQNLQPLSPGNFGYSILRTSTLSNLFDDFMDYCLNLDCEIEGLHCETGPGVWEAAIKFDLALQAADKAILFKTFAKSFFQKRDLIATFMAKWSMDYPGQSGHLHQSMFDLTSGKNLFFNAQNQGNISLLMKHYIAGVQAYLKPFLAMYAPTINSYTRLVKGSWAPTAATWGIDNRTTALRVIAGSQQAQRMEFRLGSADANPYLVAAASIGAGLLGIEKKLPLGDNILGNAYERQEELDDALQLSSNLRDANRDFLNSIEAKELFGDTFVEHFGASRDWEVREYERSLNDWQLKRYFEII